MNDFNQRHLSDQFFDPKLHQTRSACFLNKMQKLIDWQRLADIVSVLDKTKSGKGGRPRQNPTLMIKALFLQHFYGLSDPGLEEQIQDRLSFQSFVGLSAGQKAPDFTTIWKFKDELAKAGLTEALFTEINAQLEQKGLFVRKGTLVDATLIESGNRVVAGGKREQTSVQESRQIDTDARSTKKGSKWFFGYKGHIGVDMGSKLINKRLHSPANRHDSVFLEELCDRQAGAIFADKAYADERIKQSARRYGWYYGILEKKPKGGRLSRSQQKKNRRNASIRAHVEHPFAWMKRTAKSLHARAKTQLKNSLTFDFSCMSWNLHRASVLLAGSQ